MRRAVFPSQLMLCDALLIRLAFATAAASARHHGHRLMHHVSWNHEQLWHVDSRYSPWPMDEEAFRECLQTHADTFAVARQEHPGE